ncbi:MAG: hypothetical protein K9J27_02720 [Bacteroidales bacterium]|nr:hypothetical protein [Bacteroidales bacterium]MCF8332851.1 hypothetical protein [Bacteroidales bacterium]
MEKESKQEVQPATPSSEPTEEDYEKAYKFTPKELQDAWNDVATVLTGGKKDLYFTMINGKLELDQENYMITLTVRNKLQLEEVKKNRKKIVEILRRKLDNKILQLSIKIDNNPKSRKPYTRKEKFDHMVEKNPTLRDLRDKLGLDTKG